MKQKILFTKRSFGVFGLFFSCIAIFSSCSIEKRHYRSGYHVDWFSQKPARTPVQTAFRNNEPAAKTKPLNAEVKANNEGEKNIHPFLKGTSNYSAHKKNLSSEKYFAERRGHVLNEIQPAVITEEVAAKKQLNGLALLSFVCAILVVTPIFVGSILFAVIFGIIALNQISKHPGKYSGQGFAVAGLILGIIELIVLLIVVLSLSSIGSLAI